jgi:uncharacterized membrane protein
MNPFDIKAALLARHAQHPVIIHFPIALFIISVAFDLLTIWRRNPAMAKAAYYNLVAAALTAPGGDCKPIDCMAVAIGRCAA